MKKHAFVLIGLFCCLWVAGLGVAQAQTVIEEAEAAIRSGNAKALAAHFNDYIELNLEDEKSNYSKSQAEIIVARFFQKYPVQRFEFEHKGSSKEGLRYAIGKYTHSNGSFDIYLLVKQVAGRQVIETLDFRTE